MEFVSYELSKKLKEKGYPQVEKNTLAMYSEYGEWFSLAPTIDEEYSFGDFDEHDYVCPTTSQVLEWFRKDFGINLYAIKNSSGKYLWQHDACYVNEEYEREAWGGYSCPTWEETILEGIEYVLDNLIL